MNAGLVRMVLGAMMVTVVGCSAQVTTVPEAPTPPVNDPPVNDQPPAAEPQPPAQTNPVAANKCVTFVRSANPVEANTATIATVDLLTGATQMGPSLSIPTSGQIMSSMGVLGNDVYICDNAKVMRASLTDGKAEKTATECQAITADAQGLRVLDTALAQANLALFPDLGSLVANKPSKVQSGSFPSDTFGPSPTGILGLRHETNDLQRFQVDGSRSSIKLEGHAGFVYGVSAATGGRIIVSAEGRADRPEPGLFAYDAATGKSLGLVAKVPAGAPPFEGLYCGF